jgi:hypothetical protein
MTYALKIASIVVPVAVAWFMFYLLGAFVSASWNLPEWTQEARLLCALWGSVFAFAVWYRLEACND